MDGYRRGSGEVVYLLLGDRWTRGLDLRGRDGRRGRDVLALARPRSVSTHIAVPGVCGGCGCGHRGREWTETGPPRPPDRADEPLGQPGWGWGEREADEPGA